MARAFAAMTPIEAPGLGTFAVDRFWRLYWDPKMIEVWTPQGAAVVVCHEVRHLLRDHAGRRCEREHNAWNVACDAEINDDLANLPGSPVIPKSLKMDDGLLAEEYYQSELCAAIACACGSGAGGVRLPCELDEKDAPAIIDSIGELIRDAVAQDICSASKVGGDGPPAGDRVWADIRASRLAVDWKKLLLAKVRAQSVAYRNANARQTFARLHRRTMPGAVIRPGIERPAGSVAIILDTSGSMDQERACTAISVEASLRRRHPVKVICCDSAASAMKRGVYVGGGGTNMCRGIDLAEKLRGVACIVVVTDGGSPWPESKPALPTTIVLVCPEESQLPEWADVIRAYKS